MSIVTHQVRALGVLKSGGTPDVHVIETGDLRFAETSRATAVQLSVLVMRNGRNLPDFRGRYELTLRGRLDGRPWTHAMPGGARALELKHYQRTEGVIDFPAAAVVEAVEVKVTNLQGAVQARQTTDL